jgi:hypothetical protein
MTEQPDGVPEQLGRSLGRAVARARAVARRLEDPAVRERLLTAGKQAAQQHGPDIAEQAVDRALGGVARRFGPFGAALHQLRPVARTVVRSLTRR